MADNKATNKGYFQNITDWVKNKLGTTKNTETTKDDIQIIKRPGYLQYLFIMMGKYLDQRNQNHLAICQ